MSQLAYDPLRDDTKRATYAQPMGTWDGPIVSAIKATFAGTARPDQQTTAMEFIINILARVDDLSFRPDDIGGDRDTAFSEGRRFVGLQLRKVIAQPFEALTGKKTSGEQP